MQGSAHPRLVAAALVTLLGAALVVPATPSSAEDFARPNYVFLEDVNGPALGVGAALYEGPDSTVWFSAFPQDGSSAMVGISGGPGAGVQITFTAPTGQALAETTYSVPATGQPPTASTASFMLSRGSQYPACTGPAQFRIWEWTTTAHESGVAPHLAADFAGQCTPGGPTYRGSVQFLSVEADPRPVATPVRLAGSDRIDTAIRISQDRFPAVTQALNGEAAAGAVVLARSDGFADALGAAVLAANQRAPLLLTPPGGALDPRVLAEIHRVASGGEVYVVGGPVAISPTVDDQLRAEGFTPIRLAGTDRYDTAVLVAGTVPNPHGVYIVTGLDFPDGLVASALAARTRGVVVLTAGDTIPTRTAEYLATRPSYTHTAIGGPAVRATGIRAGLDGADRYETALKVAGQTLDFGTFPVVGLASGADFADALSGAAYVGGLRGPLLLTPPSGPSQGVIDFIKKRAEDQVVIFGGPAAISSSVDGQL